MQLDLNGQFVRSRSVRSAKSLLQSFFKRDKRKVEHQQLIIFKNWVAATYYYLYRQAGYPFGNNSAGFNLWMNTNIKTPFEDFCKECEEADGSPRQKPSTFEDIDSQ